PQSAEWEQGDTAMVQWVYFIHGAPKPGSRRSSNAPLLRRNTMRGRTLASQFGLCGLLLAMAISGCSNKSTAPGFGTISLKMTDAPGDFQEVNLEIIQVSAHLGAESAGESDSTAGWQVLRAESMNVDLLTLRNGVFT